MPTVDNWDEFNEKVRSLYEDNPMRCRITLKYRHNDGKLEVKATNDKKVYKYQPGHQKEIKNIDKMISTYIRAMSQ